LPVDRLLRRIFIEITCRGEARRDVTASVQTGINIRHTNRSVIDPALIVQFPPMYTESA
jgi:hypothetical protein